ncbi:MAG: hypothetical protein K2M65_01320, partial [Muribaculaceae bacterium]|nr:hypothetical protein [Muribaculaceae bacterium]
HERDVTVLDYVANMRVKTPTAAAEWLIARGAEQLDYLRRLSTALHKGLTDRINGDKTQLSFIEGQLPAYARRVLAVSSQKLQLASQMLASVSPRHIAPQHQRLTLISEVLIQNAQAALKRQKHHLEAYDSLLEALSPQAVLKRGFSMTRIEDKIVRSTADLEPGMVIITELADGRITSIVE